MHHNIHAYWQHLQNLPPDHEDLPSPRVCRLMQDMFERWQAPQVFPTWDGLKHLRDHIDPSDPPGLMRSAFGAAVTVNAEVEVGSGGGTSWVSPHAETTANANTAATWRRQGVPDRPRPSVTVRLLR